MIKFIESIRVVNGEACHLEYHFRRISRTIRHHFPSVKEEDLSVKVLALLSKESPAISKGVFKLRIIYSHDILSYTAEQYKPKIIKSLKLIEDNNIDYSYKYENRCEIDKLFTCRGECDDILIVKDGYLTDTSYCNIILEKGGHYYTPSTPLLAGTKRERLIEKGLVKEEKIRPCDINRYDKVYLINSMLDLTPVEKVLF